MRTTYLCPYSPIPRHFGGAFRVEAMWRALEALGEVQLLVLGDPPPLEARLELRRRGAVVFPSRRNRPLTWLRTRVPAWLRGESIPASRFLSRRRVARVVARVAGFHPDVVVVGDTYLSVLVPELLRMCPRVIVDTHNLDSVAHARVAASSRDLLRKLAFGALARNTAKVERRFFPLAEQVWAVSDTDAEGYRRILGLPRVAVVPNVVEFPDLREVEEEPGSVVMTGSYSYWPNADAALRLIRMSRDLHARGVLARLYLVGIAPTPEMIRAARGLDHVVVTGKVPEVRPYLERAAVVAAPIAAGSGTRLKILEGLALARPVLTTPVGAEGLGLEPGVHADVADLADFPARLAALLVDPVRRRALGRAGREWAERRFSLEAMERRVREELVGG